MRRWDVEELKNADTLETIQRKTIEEIERRKNEGNRFNDTWLGMRTGIVTLAA